MTITSCVLYFCVDYKYILSQEVFLLNGKPLLNHGTIPWFSLTITPKQLVKSTSGFTNNVYFADNLVIKFTNNTTNKQQLKKEISIYKNIQLNNIPKYIGSGEIEDYTYLIITKVKGQVLYSIWHTLDRQTQIIIVKKIANILQNFHQLNYNFLDNEYKFNNWQQHITNELTQKLNDLQSLNISCPKLQKFIASDCKQLFDTNENAGLVYNDAHFDNFLYDGKDIYLIDFDRVIYAPLDYEMLIFKTMCDIPDKFVSEKDYLNCKCTDYNFIYKTFKNEYPTMFMQNSEKRIKVYQFNYLIGQAIKCKDIPKINELLKEFNFIKEPTKEAEKK